MRNAVETSNESARWRQGQPRCVGLYVCRLADGRDVLLDYDPVGDSEIHPYGGLLDCEIVAFRRVSGQSYRTLARCYFP